MKIKVTILSLLAIAFTSSAFSEVKKVDTNQCLVQAKAIASSIDSVNEFGRNRSSEGVSVVIEKEILDSTGEEQTRLIYVFGEATGESYMNVAFNIDQGCKFNFAEIVTQE